MPEHFGYDTIVDQASVSDNDSGKIEKYVMSLLNKILVLMFVIQMGQTNDWNRILTIYDEVAVGYIW